MDTMRMTIVAMRLCCCREMEASSEKVMLRMQHEPKELLASDGCIMVQEDGEYLSEINERIDVLMSVRTTAPSRMLS